MADTASMYLSSQCIFIPQPVLKAFEAMGIHQHSYCLLALFYFRRGCPVEEEATLGGV